MLNGLRRECSGFGPIPHQTATGAAQKRTGKKGTFDHENMTELVKICRPIEITQLYQDFKDLKVSEFLG